MNVIKITTTFFALYFSALVWAEEPQSKEEQCEQYGSYQDADGNWQVCESDDSGLNEDS